MESTDTHALGQSKIREETKAYIWLARMLVFFFVEECNDGGLDE